MTKKTKVILHEYLYFEFSRTCTRCTNYWRKKRFYQLYCHFKVLHGDLGVQDHPSEFVSRKKRANGETVVAPKLKFSHSFFNTRHLLIFLFHFYYKQCIFSVSVPLTPLSTFMGRWIFGEILCKIFPWSQVRKHTVKHFLCGGHSGLTPSPLIVKCNFFHHFIS